MSRHHDTTIGGKHEMTELLIVGLGEVVDDKEIFEPNIQASLGSYKKNQASKNSPFGAWLLLRFLLRLLFSAFFFRSVGACFWCCFLLEHFALYRTLQLKLN